MTFINAGSFPEAHTEAESLVYRICGFLVEELLTCYEARSDVFPGLVSCVKHGDATADLVESMSDLDVNSVSLLMTKQVIARYLFLSCAIGLPALSAVNGALHLAALRLLECFEWGAGKGFALPPMLRACQETNLFEPQELTQIYASFAETFEDRIDTDDEGKLAEGLEDIFYALNGTSTSSTSHLIRKTLVGNHTLFDEDGCVTSLVAMIISVAPIPCFGSSYFAVPPRLRKGAVASDIESIIEIVSEAASADAEQKYSDMAVVLYAFLSTISNDQELTAASTALPNVSEGSRLARKQKKSLELDKIPAARAETALAGILEDVLAQIDLKESEFDPSLERGIAALGCLSLPDQFAKLFIEPTTHLRDVSVVQVTLSLLCSQLCGRRKAAFAAGDFIDVYLDMLGTAVDSWNRLSGHEESVKILINNMPDILKRASPEAADGVLETTWRNCAELLHQGPSLTISFLTSVKELLRRSGLPPKMTDSARRLVGKIYKDLQEFQLELLLLVSDRDEGSVFQAFFLCLAEMPHDMLEDEEYFNLVKSNAGFEAEVVKVLSLTSLVTNDYFESRQKEAAELSHVASWISKKLQANSTERVDQYAMRLVLCSFASATKRGGSTAKKDRLTLLLESLLLSKKATSRSSLEWLAAVLASWSNATGSDAEQTLGFLCFVSPNLPYRISTEALDDYFGLLVEDLPQNISSFVSRQKIGAAISNQLYRLYGHWAENGVDKDILYCIRRAFFACQSQSSHQEALVSMASTTLAESIPS